MNLPRILPLLISLLFGILPKCNDARNRGGPSTHRVRRSIDHRIDYDASGDFKPIRITVKRGLTDGLDDTHVQRLVDVVNEAVKRIESAVNVNRVVGNLRLARPGGCKQVFTSGANRDKCASMGPGYRGDKCLDGFTIPDDHQVH